MPCRTSIEEDIVITTASAPGPLRLGMARGLNEMSSFSFASSAPSLVICFSSGKSMRNPMKPMTIPPAIRIPGIEIPNATMIKCPATRKTIRRADIYTQARVIWRFLSSLLRCEAMLRRSTAVLTGLTMGRSVTRDTPTQDENSANGFIKESGSGRSSLNIPCTRPYVNG